MELLFSLVIGYLMGAVSPSYFISKKKKVDLHKEGTKNLGATNTFMVFGRSYGAFVMFFDIFKAYLSVRICQLLFPRFLLAGIAAGGAAVLGHNYPFYIRFKGGKGVAALAGFILALNFKHFIMLLGVCLSVAIIANYSCMLSFSAAILFPILTITDMIRSRVHVAYILIGALIMVITGASIIYKHTDNLKKIASGEEIKFRAFMSKYIFTSKKDR